MPYGPDEPERTYVPHAYAERRFDTGEVQLNYATAGRATDPALLLVPGQTESWWGYESAMGLLSDAFQVFAVDLRGQGRSTRTPGRYTLDNFGNDLVRFASSVIERPLVVSGLSSGGVIAAWLSAYAPTGLLRGAHYEDPPLFASEVTPACGPGIRQGAGPMFALFAKYLGDQWSIGDYAGMLAAAPRELPGWLAGAVRGLAGDGAEPAQMLKEYDPEWGRAFWTGSVGASCDHARMLAQVKCPVLFTHHAWRLDETGNLRGAISGPQVERVRALVTGAGQPFVYKAFPETPHSMHGADPELFARTLRDWAESLPKVGPRQGD